MCASTSSVFHPSYSSTLRRLARLHNRRNAVQYSPAQLQSALHTTPSSINHTHSNPSTATITVASKAAAEEKQQTIQVVPIVRAMSVGRKSTRPPRNQRLVDVMSPRLPPAPPSSPIVSSPRSVSPSTSLWSPAETPSPHLIPSPPSALLRGANGVNSSGPSVFSFQSSDLQHVRGHHRTQRSSSMPEFFLDVNSSMLSLNSEDTKSETEMSPKANGLIFSFDRVVDGNEFDRMLEEEENAAQIAEQLQEVKHTSEILRQGKVKPHLRIHTPRVNGAYSNTSSRISPSRGMLTSPPLQSMLYSHLQHLSDRFQLEDNDQPTSDASLPAVQPRRQRRNAIFYSTADSQKLREDLAADIRQNNNPLFLFSSPFAASSPSFHAQGRHRRQAALFTQPFEPLDAMSLDDSLARLSFDDVSEGEEESQSGMEDYE